MRNGNLFKSMFIWVIIGLGLMVVFNKFNDQNDNKNNNEKKITAYTEEELIYGKYLLDNKSEVLYEYLNKELMSCNNIRDNLLNKEQSVSVKNRIKAIDEDIAVINKALGRWKEQ